MPMRSSSDPLFKVDPYGTQMGEPLFSFDYDPNFIGDLLNDAWQGVKNTWYNWTGQPEKTSTYQHLEEREDSAYQRAAADMMAAGLSKYQGFSPAGSSSAGQSDPVAKQMEAQQLKSMKIANDEAKHNLDMSKQLGIRSGDTNYAAKWAELGNVLFGFDPTKVDGGLIPWVFSNLKKFLTGLDPSDPEPDPGADPGSPSGPAQADWFKELQYNMNPVLPGASYDTWKAIGSDLSKLRTPDQVENFVTGLIKSVDSKGIGVTANYSTLPDDKTLGVKGYSFEDDVNHFISEMIANGVDDDAGIYRIAEFIANKYNKDVDDVYKRLKKGVTFVVEGR